VLAGATTAGEKGIGLQMIAAQRDIDVQAQAGTLTVQARDQLQVVSANAGVTWAAPRKITLATARRPVSQLAKPRWLICF